MRQVIPFSKNIEFKTMISEITNISIEHNLSLKDTYTINGDFFITGKYKINATSPQEEDFSYKIPVDITIDPKYKTDDIELEIDDFKYEKADSNKLKVDIDLSIDNLTMKEETEVKENEVDEVKFDVEEDSGDEVDSRKVLSDEEKQEIDEIISGGNDTDLFKETSIVKEVEVPQEVQKEVTVTDDNPKEEKAKTSVGSLFTAFKDTEETFSTYSVYILRDGDNVEEIISKYKTTREALEEYNDMSNVKIGSKLIIPTTKDENNK